MKTLAAFASAGEGADKEVRCVRRVAMSGEDGMEGGEGRAEGSDNLRFLECRQKGKA